jgi:hypothetical protein
MIASNEIDRLAQNMAQRHKQSVAPTPDAPESYILFLGAGCSRAAGVPSLLEIAKKELSRLPNGVGEIALQFLSDDDMLQTFYKQLEKLSPGYVFRILQSHYSNTPVPLFYQDLALLIRNRYFGRILTTNLDTLLEQALGNAGLVPNVDFRVINLGLNARQEKFLQARAPTTQSEPGSGSETGREPVSIVKLHGDIAAGQLMITPGQIEESLKSQRGVAKQELKGDMVMVGYQFESPMLNDWLSSYRKRELWWAAAEEQPEQSEVSSWGDDVTMIVGGTGKPEEFFSQLALRLLRLPVLSFEPQACATEDADPAAQMAATALTADDEEVLSEDLRGQIRRIQASLYSLEQKASPDERPTSLQTQIDYQKQQILALEDRLRSLSMSGPRLLGLLETITDHLQSALDDPSSSSRPVSGATVNFLRQLYQAVKEQYASGEPNQQIISAAVGAAAILAERLNVEHGVSCVTTAQVRELASFVPTVATRGIK